MAPPLNAGLARRVVHIRALSSVLASSGHPPPSAAPLPTLPEDSPSTDNRYQKGETVGFITEWRTRGAGFPPTSYAS